MTTWTKKFENDLDRLLRHARKMSKRGLLVGHADEPTEQVTRFGNGVLVLIEGEGVPLLRSCQRQLAGRSRATSGFSPDEAQALLLEACQKAVEGTIKGAVADLRITLAQPLADVEVVEHADLILPTPRLIVGQTTYTRRDRTQFGPSTGPRRDFAPPLASTVVRTRGYATAKVLARRRFDDSLAIIELIAPPQNTGPEATGLRVTTESGGSLSFQWRGSIISARAVSGWQLITPYKQLAKAAAKDATKQTDWERRLLAATRWFMKGCRSDVAADRLAGAMVALECMFVAGKKEKGFKGDLIAERLTARFKLNEKTADEQIAWLKELYSARNDAIHEGRDFDYDLDVDRLLDLTRYALRGLVWHLNPKHNAKGKACRTYVAAMACSDPPTP